MAFRFEFVLASDLDFATAIATAFGLAEELDHDAYARACVCEYVKCVRYLFSIATFLHKPCDKSISFHISFEK